MLEEVIAEKNFELYSSAWYSIFSNHFINFFVQLEHLAIKIHNDSLGKRWKNNLKVFSVFNWHFLLTILPDFYFHVFEICPRWMSSQRKERFKVSACAPRVLLTFISQLSAIARNSNLQNVKVFSGKIKFFYVQRCSFCIL